ncbi:MAG: hypothetical protein KH334_01245 [Clostridiales bacterium]|nr:hypothetical protein [Clostridiales bacterium]
MGRFGKKIVLIGAGNIGKGYLGDLFAAEGFHLTFLTHRQEQAESLRSRGSYTLYKTSEKTGETQKVMITGFDAYSTAGEREQCIQALCETNYASVHLYPGAYRQTAELLAEAICRRAEQCPDQTLDIFFCVNSIGPAKEFSGYILPKLLTAAQKQYFESKVGLVETLTYRNAFRGSPEMLAIDPDTVMVSDYGVLPVDGDAMRGEIPIPALVALDKFQGRVTNKIWNINMRHYTLALYTAYQGDSLMWKGAVNPYNRYCTTKAAEEATFAVMQEFGFTFEDLKKGDRNKDDNDWWKRCANPEDTDTVARVAADPIRKLAKGERLVGPTLCCLKHGRIPYFLSRSVALGYCYKDEQDQNAVALQAYLAENGIAAALEKYSGLTDADPDERLLRQLICAQYEELTHRGGQA